LLEAEELRSRLAECLAALPPAWRAVLSLREGEGLRYEQIAELQGLVIGTVRSRLARARELLQRCLEEPRR
jgi:RNA polymerase sigma-70 factor (ECF subfamily)